MLGYGKSRTLLQMQRSKRHQMIRDVLIEKGAASTTYLSERLEVSEATIRRDVQALVATDPNMRRVHGGIELRDIGNNLEYMFDLKLNRNVELKVPIAHAVAELVHPNQTIIIDSGSTCYFAATQIARLRGIRIVTVDIKISEALGRYENVSTVVIGGEMRPGFYTVGESMAVAMLAELRADIALLGIDGITADFGISNAGIFEVGIKRQIIRSAARVVGVCDRTKLGLVHPYRVCDARAIDTLVTNSGAEASVVEAVRKCGVEVITV